MGNRLLVVGGVAAGTSAASRARRIDPDLDIVLFEAGDDISYGACDEPYVISGLIPSWEKLLVRRPEVFREKQHIDIRLHHRVTAIDPDAKTLTVHDQAAGRVETVPYDRLILATGARPRTLRLPGADAPNVFHLKSLESVRAILDFLAAHPPRTVVSIGAGFINLELAEAFQARGIANTIIDVLPHPGAFLDGQVAALVEKELADRGVTFLPDTAAQGFQLDDGGRVSAVQTKHGPLACDMVMVGIGVVPNVELGVAAGVRLGPTGAFAVDDRQRTNLPDVYAAGDCVETLNRVSGKPHHYPLGDIANKQGWTAGENAAGGDATYGGALGSLHFRVFDLEVGVTGINAAEARAAGFDPVVHTTTHASRSHAQPGRREITLMLLADRASHRLLGAQIAGKDGAALRINNLAVALHAGLTVEELNAVDMAYAPPFSPVIDPTLMAARVFSKKLAGVDE